MPETFVFRLPKLSDSTVEATVTEWLKSEGDAVAEGEMLVAVETDKVLAELPSPVSGTLLVQHVEIDEDVAVGDPLADIETS